MNPFTRILELLAKDARSRNHELTIGWDVDAQIFVVRNGGVGQTPTGGRDLETALVALAEKVLDKKTEISKRVADEAAAFDETLAVLRKPGAP